MFRACNTYVKLRQNSRVLFSKFCFVFVFDTYIPNTKLKQKHHLPHFELSFMKHLALIFTRRSHFPFQNTASNNVISPNFLVLQFCEKAQFHRKFHKKLARFCKISTTESWVKLRDFTQWNLPLVVNYE